MNSTEEINRRRPILRLFLGIAVFALIIFGISSCNFPDLGAILPLSDPTQAPGEEAIQATPEPSPTPNLPAVSSKNLIIWVPPQFDPTAGNAASDLFQARLDDFTSRRPQSEIQVRVKHANGEFGMMESLRLVSDAAPIIKPDLVALPRALAEDAFREGYLLPLNEYADQLEDDDWYDYARDLAMIDDQWIGFPFAGDLMVMAFKNDNGDDVPTDWNAVLASERPLAFSAADPRGLVTLAHYQSLLPLDQENDKLTSFQEEELLEIFTYYQAAQSANVMPYWLTQFETDQQAWQSYEDRQSTMVITWSSYFLNSETANTSLAAIPTMDARPFSYADGWVWCVIESDQETEQEAVELAVFLTDEEYLNGWNYSSGYLPVYASGLDIWSGESYFSALQQLMPSAMLIPENEVLADLGPSVREAVVGVLKDQELPETVVSTLLEKFSSP